MVTETMDYQGMVAEFMKASGQVVNTAPTEMTTELAHLRYNLYIEEVQELKDAIEANDRVEQLDALCDILYIVMGTANSMGMDTQDLQDKIGFVHSPFVKSIDDQIRSEGTGALVANLEELNVKEVGAAVIGVFVLTRLLSFTPGTFNEAFRRVHVSNMSKFCRSEQEARETIDSYIQNGVDTFWVQQGDWYVVLRRSDNKVLKSINYNPVDLTDLI